MMSIKKLYIFVEGNDDQLFFERAIVPMVENVYDDIEIIQYAQMKKEKVNLYLLSIATLNFDYIFTCDIDYISTIEQKKKVIRSKFDLVESDKISVAVKEIESWYIAGFPDKVCKSFGIRPRKRTDDLTKEQFNLLYHSRFHSRLDFMIEILNYFSHEEAKKKNKSYKFFAEKWIDMKDQKDLGR
jgi:hypothetical protein